MKKTRLSKQTVFKAIADPTRREIFHLLVMASAALSINEISDHFTISRQGVTKHIKMLNEAGLVAIRPEGRERYCLADPSALKEIHDWVSFYEKFWDDKLRSLGDFLDKTKGLKRS